MLDDQNNLKLNIITAICNMDVEGLKLYLPDNKIYFEMTKATFIVKMNELFDDLKNRGDSCFTSYPGQCISTMCRNKTCNGFAFISDYTKEHFSFIIENQNNILESWTQCFDLLPNNCTLDEEKNIMINVWNEEKYDFEADDDFLQTISDVKQAKIILGDLSHEGISRSSLLLWLDRYEKLFTDSDFFYHHRCSYYKSFAEFGKLFFVLVDLGILIKNQELIVTIIDEMKYTKRKRHLKLYDENKELLSTLFCVDIYRDNGLTSEGNIYHFDDQDFKELFDYIELSHDLIYKYHH
jgi:hypothetical protein